MRAVSTERRAGRGLRAGLTGVAALLGLLSAALGCGGNAEEPRCQNGGDDCLPVSPESCMRDGSSYASGSNVPAEDGCNSCRCSNGGWSCTAAACLGDSCVYDGRIFPDTSRFSSTDGCNTCTCSDGAVACTERGCPTVPATCSYGGEQLAHGEGRLDGCNTCTCSNGTMVCTDRACTVGCYRNDECGDAQYCALPQGLCTDPGSAGSNTDAQTEELRAPSGAQPLPPGAPAPLTGVCRERPTQCSGAEAPVCGCDRVTYRTECAAASLGLSLVSTGPCSQPD